jgi:hypothetical protein
VILLPHVEDSVGTRARARGLLRRSKQIARGGRFRKALSAAAVG